jgi:hypothetical protein
VEFPYPALVIMMDSINLYRVSDIFLQLALESKFSRASPTKPWRFVEKAIIMKCENNAVELFSILPLDFSLWGACRLCT